MATFAERKLPLVYKGRSVAGRRGFRPYRIFLLHDYHDGEYWSGPQKVELTEGNGQPPRVKFPSGQDVPFGAKPTEIAEIGPVTPIAANLALLESWLAPVLAGETRHISIVGPGMEDGRRYRVIDINTEKSLRWMIRVQSEGEALRSFED